MGLFGPFIDWDGNGQIDPVDVGISMALADSEEEQGEPKEPEVWDGERIALISCSKLKKPYRCRASELYSASTLFSLSYSYAKAHADRVYIISAKHGLLSEDEIIEPYNETLKDKPAAERRAWARMVLEQLEQVCDIERDTFIILAGKYYYEHLLPNLLHTELPLGNLPMGKRIEFLQQTLAAQEEVSPRSTAETDRLQALIDAAKHPAQEKEPVMLLQAGDRINHSAFGDGTVLSVQGTGVGAIIDVHFDERGKKKLMLAAAAKCITKYNG